MSLPICVCINPDNLVHREKLERPKSKFVHVVLKFPVHQGELLRIKHIPRKIKQIALSHQSDAVEIVSVKEGFSTRVESFPRIILIKAKDIVRHLPQLVQAAGEHFGIHGLPLPIQVILVQV